MEEVDLTALLKKFEKSKELLVRSIDCGETDLAVLKQQLLDVLTIESILQLRNSLQSTSSVIESLLYKKHFKYCLYTLLKEEPLESGNETKDVLVLLLSKFPYYFKYLTTDKNFALIKTVVAEKYSALVFKNETETVQSLLKNLKYKPLLEVVSSSDTFVKTGTVKLFYRNEDFPLVLRVDLSALYPIERPVLTAHTRLATLNKLLRTSLLPHWVKVLQFQRHSSSAAEGLLPQALRKILQNVDKLYSNAQECLICFDSVLDVNNRKYKCKTCSWSFHKKCVEKWFSESNSSACPHCRENFS